MTCTCHVFDIDRLPCVHTIAALHHARVGMYTLASSYYMKETIYPVRLQSQWKVPDEVVAQVVKPREVKERKAEMLEISFSGRD